MNELAEMVREITTNAQSVYQAGFDEGRRVGRREGFDAACAEAMRLLNKPKEQDTKQAG